jgi:outer membrane lipoprotein LolB
MRGARVTRVTILLPLLALAACTTTATRTIATRNVEDLSAWQARGRIAVSGVESGGSGSFVWSQHGASTDIQVRGPVGVGSVQVSLQGSVLRIKTSDGQAFEAADAAAELEARLGASVPTDELRYWMVGRAAPGEHQWTVGDETATLIQQAWRIDYQRYAITQGVRLPMKLVAASGATKVRIVIDRWTVE